MIAELAGDDEPFFEQRSTHNLVDDLSKLTDVTLYIGAGASIERTGLTWAGLSAQLLDKDLGNYESRISIVRAQSELATSSAIDRQFKRTHADNAQAALVDAIRELFYGGPRVQPSYFNERVIAFANDLIGAGRRVVVVTPNYDDFLFDAVQKVLEDGSALFDNVEFFGFGMSDGAASPLRPQLSELGKAIRKKSTLCIVYTHGFVSRTSDPLVDQPRLDHVDPVFSERDYSLSRPNTEEVLGLLFRKRDVLILGSSLTDPPLLHALADSNAHNPRPGRARIAIRPLQGIDLSQLADDDFASFRRVEDDRAEHLGLRIVNPPFFFQSPQLLEEARVALALAHGSAGRARRYSAPGSTPRYGYRLDEWWQAWNEDDDYPLQSRQFDSHRLLRNIALDFVGDLLECPEDEDLRVEAWIRHHPGSRELRLWASSTGNWPDIDTARHEKISLKSEYSATYAFLNGAPTYEGHPEDPRWKSFLSKPIRYTNERYNTYLPVGVISLASMRPQSTGSLNPRYKENIGQLFLALELIGTVLFFPEYKTELREAAANGVLEIEVPAHLASLVGL
jgi:hypothetical protein